MTSEASASPPEDWWGDFHVNTFLRLTLADLQLERRERVWIKRFFRDQGRPELLPRLERAAQEGPCDEARYRELAARARDELSSPEKRRTIYNLAQLCKSRGRISDSEYEAILEVAEQLGMEDTAADGIVNSVFSINDTFRAILGLFALGAILYFTRDVIVPLVVALFLTMIINRVEGAVSARLALRRWRWINKVLAMVLILSVLFGLVMATVVSGRDIARRVPHYQAKVTTTLADMQRQAVERGLPVEDIGLTEQLEKLPIASTLSGLFSSVMDLLGTFFLVVIFTGFLVFSGDRFRGLMGEMNDKISTYISIKAVVSMATGGLVFLICWVFGLDFPLFWATTTFLLNFIPSVGSIIATIPPVLLAMLQFSSWPHVAGLAAALISTQMVIGNLIEPRLMGSKLAVKPVAILLGLIFWGYLWGLPGMFLAAPLMALLRILASYYNFSRSLERLLAA